MANVVSLSSLSTREAIQDAAYRCVIGIDTADQELFDSAFFPDGIFNLNGNVMEGLSKIHEDCYNGVAKIDTTHFLTNFRIDYKEGASTASLTCSALAEHFKPGEGVQPGAHRLTSGSIYYIDVAKDGDLWKIKKLHLKLIWAQGDMSVITG